MYLRRPLWLLLPMITLGLVGYIATRSARNDSLWSRPGGATATPLSFPEPSIIADCGLLQPVGAWLDANANGQREPAELPLAGVEFFVVDITDKGSPWDYGRLGVSDGSGLATLTQFIGGCDDITFDISARAPADYRATTGLHFTLSGYKLDKRIEFGFAPEL